MHRVFRQFLEGIRESNNVESMRSVMVEAIVAFDLRSFTYFSPSGGHRGANIFISTYPEAWTDHYFAQGYDSIDPVFDIARATGTPFHWGKDAPTIAFAGRQQQLFDEAAGFGIRNGLTFPLAFRNETFAALTVVSEQSTSTFLRDQQRVSPTLQSMAVAFHAAVRRKRWITQCIDGVHLTRRELECLHWTAQGKSTGETGQIIGVRPCTVTFHLENAKRKLGVRSVCQAVARFAASN